MSPFVHTGGRDNPEGAVIVFLHGAGMDHTVWRFQTRWLAHRGWRVLAPDLPGHGRSGGDPLTSVADRAGWLVDFLSGTDPPLTLVGHSLGALVAVETAAREPGRVGALVLVGAGARMPVHPELMAAAPDDLDRAAAFIAGWSMPPAHRGGHPEPGTWEQGALARLVGRSRPGVLAADLEASAAYDASAGLVSVDARTLVVRGEADRMVSGRSVRELADGIPGARLVTVPRAGHQPMIQRPREFNHHLAEFLDDDGKGRGR